MTYEEFKSKRLDDVGTRYQHYSDLLSVWEEGVSLISDYSHVGKHDQSKLDVLNTSIELLRNTLDGMGDYHDTLITLRKLVDYVPTDPTVIPEGRGTPLKGNPKLGELGDGNG